ncbi:hypothetical protein [Arthrobacter mangrovi]|uniref:Uncharacterized protein n=1 Tax=Arthrobacter mangrovi TaxID=2966350 RepID=A0ABQ5MW43_9MICC|nr:hypothetical protein [Arthrobacter mangrovi]GLB68160.1 hypothetical protein AHIS1636_26020 [Arthrobacter mangrovi]
MTAQAARVRQSKELRVAAAAFAAAVLMGVGAGAAAAKWSQSAEVEVSVAVGIVGSGCSFQANTFTIRWEQAPNATSTVVGRTFNNGQNVSSPEQWVPTGPDQYGYMTLTLPLDKLQLQNDNRTYEVRMTSSDGASRTWTLSHVQGTGQCPV